LNFFETDGILSVLKENGYRVANELEEPSHIIINTCTVTNRADVKNRNVIRSAIKKHPLASVWVTGCYAETDRTILESIPGVAAVVGNAEKSGLAYKIMSESGYAVSGSESKGLDRFSYSDVLPDGHTRAYLKVQDGCNRKCSYCKIPQARGLGVSRDMADVLDQVSFLQDSGVGEIILTGVNLGWYRDSSGQKSFIPLLEKILNKMDYARLRLSSIEPPDVSRELADLLSHPRFCNFLHVPVQSGSHKILRDMKRTYNPISFRKRIELVLEKVPQIFLGTDVIAGFPGEGEEEFQETMDLLKDLKFSRVHAFPYSVRKNTHAESLGDTIPKAIKKERVLSLMNYSNEQMNEYISRNKGNVLEAILENDGILVTDNYIKGKIQDEKLMSLLRVGQFVDVEVSSVDALSDSPLAVFTLRK
jgi:threonylcarbamoyladenosine tRNA methylthiotransferase MtaB